MSRWPLVQLGEVGKVSTGSTPKTSDPGNFGGNIPFVTPADLGIFEPIVATPRTLTQKGSAQARLIPADSIMVCCIGSLGKAGIAGRDLATNQQINSITFDPSRVFPRFGLRAVARLSSKMESIAPATTLPIISKSKFQTLEIPLPPLDEQRRIAAILDQADALRRKRREALATLASLKSSIFEKTFGDLDRWPTVSLGELVSDTRIGLVRGAVEFGDGLPFPYVRMNAITRDGEIDSSTIKTTDASEKERTEGSLRAGDFLFNTRNSKELVGKTAVWRGSPDALFNNNIMRIRFGGRANAEFVQAAFSTKGVRHELEIRKSGTTSVFAVYWRDLKSLPIPLPPIVLQSEFAASVQQIEEQKEKGRDHLAHLDTLFASLQHRAFRGEL